MSHNSYNDYSDTITPSLVPKYIRPLLTSPIVYSIPDDSDSSTDSDDDWVIPHTANVVPEVAIAQQPVDQQPLQVLQQQPPPGRPRRNVRAPVYLQDYHRASLEPLPGDDDLNDPWWLQADDDQLHGAGHRAGDARRGTE